MQLNPVGTLIDDSAVDHLNIQNIGVNSHAQIDIHIADATLHFTEGSIDHTAIGNIGTNTHPAIDVHIADADIHFSDAPADAQSYVRNNNAWLVASSGGVTDHTLLSNIGVNTHAQIDTHIADADIHFSDAPADAQSYVRNNNAWLVASAGVTDHTLLSNIGVNTHVQIDTHLADASIHFTEASIDHTAIANVGVTSHVDIDSHIGNGTLHFTEASIDHTAIANIGINSHTAIDSHIADTSIHFAVGSIDHAVITNIGVNTHAQIDTHLADATIHLNEAAVDITHLRLDTTNDPLTGALTAQQIEADTNQSRDIGTTGPTGRFLQMRARIGNFLGFSSDGGNVVPPAGMITYGINPTGIMGGNVVQTGAGITTFRHGSGSGAGFNAFKPVATIGNAFSSGPGDTGLINNGGGSFLGGSSYNGGAGAILLTSTNFGNFTWAYAYSQSSDHTFRNGAAGGFLGGYSQGPATITVENFSQGPGCFTWVRPTGGAGTSTINVFNRGDGGFLQGAPLGAAFATTLMEITNSGIAGFLQGRAQGAATMQAAGAGAFCQGFANASDIIALGAGSFARGQARGGNAITASGIGSFAVGDSNAGAITASALNATQFGPGTNALADSLQVGAAGLRFKGTTGAPGAPQNGDFWVNGAFVYVRSNGANIQIAGPGPLTN